jgi:hypothetical protein
MTDTERKIARLLAPYKNTAPILQGNPFQQLAGAINRADRYADIAFWRDQELPKQYQLGRSLGYEEAQEVEYAKGHKAGWEAAEKEITPYALNKGYNKGAKMGYGANDFVLQNRLNINDRYEETSYTRLIDTIRQERPEEKFYNFDVKKGPFKYGSDFGVVHDKNVGFVEQDSWILLDRYAIKQGMDVNGEIEGRRIHRYFNNEGVELHPRLEEITATSDQIFSNLTKKVPKPKYKSPLSDANLMDLFLLEF